ncbi:MAG: hypothetical protein LJF04_15045 [Gemmatimonadetes bacterium]|nr:hypothetical protein [Gemmatimonadota bacterium]
MRATRRVLLPVLMLLAVVGARPAAALQLPGIPDTINGLPYSLLTGARTQVRFARGDSLLAARVQQLLESEAPLPGLPPADPRGVSVVVAHSTAAFDALTGGRVPEWRAAVAIPDRNLMVLPSHEGRSLVDAEGRRVLRHEWAHLGLHQYLGELLVPRWFDEGYAQWASGGWDASQAWRLRILLALGRTPPLDSLSLDWPRDEASADAAYLLAASAVAYLLQESGTRGLALFLQRWRDGRSFEGALRLTFGVTSSQFEEDWRSDVRKRYGWLFVFSHSVVFWLVVGVALLGMVRVRRARNREHLARLRAGEIPDRPAWWTTDPEGGGSEQVPPGVDGPGEKQ